MVTNILVLCIFVLFSRTQCQQCSLPGLIQNPYLTSPLISNALSCGLNSPRNRDTTISQNCVQSDILSVLTETNGYSKSQAVKPCLSNVGSSCSCNDNGVFIPCDTPIVLNIDIPNGITVSNLGSTTGTSTSCVNQNNAPLGSISNGNSYQLASNNQIQKAINSGSVRVTGSSLNIGSFDSNYLSGLSKPNSQTLNIISNTNNNPCLASDVVKSQITVPISISSKNQNCVSNLPTLVQPQITSIPSVSLPKGTSCGTDFNIPSSTKITSFSSLPSLNLGNSLPTNPFAPCSTIPNVVNSPIDFGTSLNSPSLSNIINAPCNKANSNTLLSNNLLSCINGPSTNIVSSLSPTLLYPCTGPYSDLNDDYILTQSSSPCVKPFPNVQTVTSIDQSCNRIVSNNLNTPNIQTVQAIPCGCSKLSSVTCPQNAIPCECSRLSSSSLNQISTSNSVLDNNCNFKTVPNSVVNLPIVLKNPSVSCQTNAPLVLPQVITSSVLDLANLNSLNSPCGSLLSSISQPTTIVTSPPVIPSSTSPVIATTVIDNTVSNSLANAIQLLIVSNLIQSLNRPTLPISNAASVDTVSSSEVYSQASPVGAVADAAVTTATATSSSTVGNNFPEGQTQNYYNNPYNGYQDQYYPNLYDIVAQKVLEDCPLSPITSRILGLPEINIPENYNSPYDNNFGQNTFYGPPEANFYGPQNAFPGPYLNDVPNIYPDTNFIDVPNFIPGPNINSFLPNFNGIPNIYPGSDPYGVPMYPDSSFNGAPFYPEANYGVPNFYPEPNFYGVQDYQEPYYGYPNAEVYPDMNNFYGVPDVYQDSNNFFDVPEMYADVNNYYEEPDTYVNYIAVPYVSEANSANTYSVPALDDSINYYVVPEVNTNSNAYVEETINSAIPTYTTSIKENIYLIPENVPISNPTYTFEPVNIPTYKYLDSCPSLSVQSPAEVYIPSNIYSSSSFTPAPFYIGQRETTSPLSAVTSVAAEIYIPSEIKANLICDLDYLPSSLPVVNVAKPMFEIEPDFSKCYCL